jgi:Photosynthesis system II assembly factor YCF48
MNNDSARDKAMDKLVEAKLRSGLHPASGNCPDAEILAAYVERTLTVGERAHCQAHLASCAHCQAQVAVLVRLSEADEPAVAPPKAAAPASAAGMSWFRWAWAGPALAALLVVGIYVSGPFKQNIQQIPGPQDRIQQPARSKPATTPAVTEEQESKIALPASSESGGTEKRPKAEEKSLDLKSHAIVTAGKPASRQNETPSSGALGGTSTRNESPAKTQNEETKQTPVAPTPPPPPAPASNNVAPTGSGAIATPSERAALSRDDRGQGAGTGGGVGGNAPSGAAGATVPAQNSNNPPANQPMGNFSTHRRAAQSSVPQAIPPPAPPKTVSNKSASQDEVGAKKEAQATSTEGDKLSENVREKQPAAGGVAAPATAQALMVTSSPSVPVWRVGRHGLIQKLNPDGKWKKQKSGVKADLYAIAFSGADVGWAVGQAGTVLRTTDGGTVWNQLPRPTTEDLVGVTPTSGQSASVVTRSGQTFTTTDAGNSWSAAGQ